MPDQTPTLDPKALVPIGNGEYMTVAEYDKLDPAKQISIKSGLRDAEYKAKGQNPATQPFFDKVNNLTTMALHTLLKSFNPFYSKQQEYEDIHRDTGLTQGGGDAQIFDTSIKGNPPEWANRVKWGLA